jgi:hypothetical protein
MFQSDVGLPDLTNTGSADMAEFPRMEVNTSISGWLRFPDGVRYRINGGTVDFIEDANGNRTKLEYETIQDSQNSTQTLISTFRVTKATDSIGRETTFEYDKIEGGRTVDRITYWGGPAPPDSANPPAGAYARKYLIENIILGQQYAMTNPLHGRLFPAPSSSSVGLFLDLNDHGSLTTILYPLIGRIILPNGREYSMFYNMSLLSKTGAEKMTRVAGEGFGPSELSF